MTRKEARERVRFLLQEPDPSGRFSDTELNIYINEAYRMVSERSDILVKETEIPVSPGNSQIILPSGVLDIKRIKVGDRVLDETTQDEMDRMFASWESMNGTPQWYIRYSPSVVRLVPTPDRSMTAFITHSYAPVSFPLDVSGDDEAFDLPDSLVDSVVRFAAYRALMVDENPRAQQMLQEFEMYFNDAVARLRRFTTKALTDRVRTTRR